MRDLQVLLTPRPGPVTRHRTRLQQDFKNDRLDGRQEEQVGAPVGLEAYPGYRDETSEDSCLPETEGGVGDALHLRL